MKEIKAYIHRNRVAEVISALKSSAAWTAVGNNEHNLTAYMVKGSLVPLDESERRFSVELGDEVINEYKLELHCSEEHVDELVKIIVALARTGQANSGWVYVMDVVTAVPVL
ncbi:MAG: P-II family nitrogen regulator [Polaromonas sp.]|jgi:nitrogen regulatory protein P-II 1|uniref:P-II family nitrogen regulator n=1 Tax=unclassified Polaromonas TaxID=2638319 RepID=UPI000BCA4099|nr:MULTISPECIES: P-II family nitrogen regulator [unclassified Polaromonas]MDO8771566.1 P-II family nitrogen regulator [Burkholderiaceae bacterium]MDI1237225.1 P-II family nitrogen regulator [Polaromonas sp.]MDO9260062.1 P-II family nitrogen regulator [Polaromonas sp.]OYY33471.1 MAG: transcriptional regulator [Polaromonas sp. 35-63-35]OYZ17754.1 MAG: transcriptional regulator [Polaromonas sp. 16-63-31]